MYYLEKITGIIILLSTWMIGFCQPNTTIDLDKEKPKQYENRRLTSEKTGEKKFNSSRRLFQNTITHYNYFFNADNKLNDVIAIAKTHNIDDFTKLLSFYNYSLDATSIQKQQLDSVIYKCNAGILLHDLRNDWIDNMYLLLGKAFLLRKDFDSSAQVFQYINYAYAPKDDGYDIPIGSNASNTNGIFTVSTDEKTSLLKKMTGRPPSRNESFLWQARNYLEQNKLEEASGLLSILRSDIEFPSRLQTDLHEMVAYLFYKQQVYDSAAWHLQKSLNNTVDKSERARWEYLCGQLYQLAGKGEAAIILFNHAIQHTSDPYMDVYARLNIVALSSDNTKDNMLQRQLAELYSLARRDKYENFRDIIYYASAILQLQNKDTVTARKDLSKSIQFSVDNPPQKQKSFLLLADINYKIRKYTLAFDFYDSLQTNMLTENEAGRVSLRKPALKIITDNLNTIHLQDSLLALSSFTEAERLAAAKKIYRKLRKAQGMKDAEDIDFGSSFSGASKSSGLFNNNVNGGDFYFSNATMKAQGYKEFKSLWGARPNIDNWQRQNAMIASASNGIVRPDNRKGISPELSVTPENTKDKEVSLEGLLSNIPLTESKIAEANHLTVTALFKNGEIFQNQLEDYQAASDAFETILRRFPAFLSIEQVLFDLAYCSKEQGLLKKYDSIRSKLNTTYPNGKWTIKINNGVIENQGTSIVTVLSNPKEVATRQYEEVYNLFVEGKFKEAEEEKQNADKRYGKNYWTPQLLYIESIYYVKQRQDTEAINRLQNIISTFPSSPLSVKAKDMVEVLKRRKEIEAYLTTLQIDKNEDTAINRRIDLNPSQIVAIDARKKLLAKDTVVEIKSALTVIKGLPEIKQKSNSLATTPNNNNFIFVPDDQHYAVVILDKVDEVFVSEARNAFNRFNREKYYNQKIDITPLKLNDQYNMMLVGPFASAGEAVNYIDNIKPSVSSRIIPWLTQNKYSFSIISNANLTILKTNKNVEGYRIFLRQIFSDKF
jgi:outer membrane protein assembly factor BamD (BamD/ComL family)